MDAEYLGPSLPMPVGLPLSVRRVAEGKEGQVGGEGERGKGRKGRKGRKGLGFREGLRRDEVVGGAVGCVGCWVW